MAHLNWCFDFKIHDCIHIQPWDELAPATLHGIDNGWKCCSVFCTKVFDNLGKVVNQYFFKNGVAESVYSKSLYTAVKLGTQVFLMVALSGSSTEEPEFSPTNSC